MATTNRPLAASSKLIAVAGAETISLTVLGLPNKVRAEVENYENNSSSQSIHQPINLATGFSEYEIRSIRANEKMLRSLHQNLDSKTLILSRLMHEANEQAKELAKSAEEMVVVKSMNESLGVEIEALCVEHSKIRTVHTSRTEDMQNRQEEAAEHVKMASNQDEKHAAQIEGLQAAIVELQIKQKEMIHKIKQLNQIIREAPAMSSTTGKKVTYMKKMEGAIRVQMMYIERMRKENEDILVLKERAERNERVIAMMEKKLYSANSGDESTIAMNPRVKYRIRDLHDQIMEASDRERALHMVLTGEEDDGLLLLQAGEKSNAKSEAKSGSGDDGGSRGETEPPPKKSTDDKPAKNSSTSSKSVEALKTRCVMLRKQLVGNAKSFAGELSKVKLDLMQAEVGGGSDDD